METAAFKEHVQKSWHAVGARDNQDIPMSYCWVLPDGWHLFQAFPEVLCVYGTHETNNKHRPLLSLSLKDSDGKYVMVVVRCLMKILVVPFAMWRSPFCAFRDSITVLDAFAPLLVSTLHTCCRWQHLVHQGWRQDQRGLDFWKGNRQAARSQVSVIQDCTKLAGCAEGKI